MEDVWNTKENWDNKYKDFCKLKFKDAKIEELDDEADDYTRKLTQYPKGNGITPIIIIKK